MAFKETQQVSITELNKNAMQEQLLHKVHIMTQFEVHVKYMYVLRATSDSEEGIMTVYILYLSNTIIRLYIVSL